MALAAPMSPTEFLAFEREAEVRHDFQNGIVTEIPGGSFAHSALKVALVRILFQHRKSTGYVVTDSDMRVLIPGDGYVYPDATLVREPKLESNERDILLNPVTVFEVLSPLIGPRDRTAKFDAYASIPSIQEYVLISSTERRMEVFRRDGDVWLFFVHRDGDTAIVGEGQIALPLIDLYDEVPR